MQAALATYVNKETGKRRYVVGVSQQMGKHRVKAKVDQKGKVSVAGVMRLAEGVNLSVGGQVGSEQNRMGYSLDLSL